MDRRRLIAGALAASAVPGLARGAPAPLAIPASGKLQFSIFRNNQPFGNYQVVFAKDGDAFRVTTDVAMIFKLLGVTSFQYQHHCEEVWRGGQFMALRSRSITDNHADEAETVSAVRSDYAIDVTTRKDKFVVPLNANPLTHWNSATLGGTLFNPQDGKRLSFTAQPVGHDAFPRANGVRVNGAHWMLRGDQQIDEWYDDAGVWAGLRAVFPDHSIVEYRRV